MTLIKTIQNADNEKIKDIKTVKNASIFISNDIIYCRHYDTVIFAYDQKNKVCEIMKDCSRTSNKQIQYLLDSLSLTWDDCVNVNELSKWAYSESIYQ